MQNPKMNRKLVKKPPKSDELSNFLILKNSTKLLAFLLRIQENSWQCTQPALDIFFPFSSLFK